MKTVPDLWRRVRDQRRRRLPSAPTRGREDEALLALADEFEAGDRALRDLLERDGRDTGDVPDFDALADRQAELVRLIVATRARSSAGAVSKARCARLRPLERGFDAAIDLALSACDDLLHLASAPPARRDRPSSPPGPWLCFLDASIQIGAWSLVGSTLLLFEGIQLTGAVVLAVLATGGAGTFLAFCMRCICLRRFDRSG